MDYLAGTGQHVLGADRCLRGALSIRARVRRPQLLAHAADTARP